MKPKILACYLIIAISSLPFFSSSQAQWNTTGGNSVTTTNTYLGTNGSSTSSLQIKTIETGANALPINFYTNNTQRATIDASGNVGIGTAAPCCRLEINQGTSGNSGLRFTQLTSSSDTSSGNGKVLSVNSSGDVILVRDSSVEIMALIKKLEAEISDLEQQLSALIRN